MTVGSASPRREPPGRTPTKSPLKVMVVDDSITARTVHSRIVSGDEAMSVVAIAGSAEQAISLLETVRVDVILLDLDMPGVGGLDALPRIIKAARGARIMVVSSLTVDGAEQTLAALAQGAADTLPKPAAGAFNEAYRETLRKKVRALGRASARTGRPILPIPPARPRTQAHRKPAALAIGASTGGIHALGRLFGALPKGLPLPILVTQHLPSSFMPVFARQLQTISGCEALVAEDDDELLPGRILVAPGDAHMTFWTHGSTARIRLDRQPVENGCMPSVDPMFAGIAEMFGADALGVVLSGMGRDGTAGAARIIAAGGAIFAQDEESSAVWGMPRAIAEAGLASAILPPDEIGCRITASLRSASWR